MTKAVKLLQIVTALISVGGCAAGSTTGSGLAVPAYGGMDDRMASCMRYASESYCEREIWGGNEP